MCRNTTNARITNMVGVLHIHYDFRPFQSHVPALPVHVDSHKGRACPPDWESIHASQEIRVVRREFPRSLPTRAKSTDEAALPLAKLSAQSADATTQIGDLGRGTFARQAHAFMREPWAFRHFAFCSTEGNLSP